MANYVKEANWQEETPHIYTDDETADSTTIRTEINATRERLGQHLDKIQERFQPENIKQQTQNAVESAFTDSIDSAKEYVNDYVQKVDWNAVRDGVLSAVQRNPVPTALVGVGLGWMFLNGSRSNRPSAKRRQHSNGQTSRHGLGWREETPQMESPNETALRRSGSRPPMNQATQTQRNGVGYSSSFDSAGSHSNDTETNDPSLLEQVKDGVSDAASQVRDGVRNASNSLYEQASTIGNQLQTSAEHVADSASEWTDQLQETGESASQWSQDAYDSISDYTNRTLDENPMMFGAVALAVGAGLGMLLPATRYESNVYADLRQQALQTAKGFAEEVKERAQVVVDELQPEIQKTAATVVKSVEDVGKQAVDEVRQSIQKVSDKLDNQSEFASKA